MLQFLDDLDHFEICVTSDLVKKQQNVGYITIL